MSKYRRYVALTRLSEILESESADALLHLRAERGGITGWKTQTMGDGTPHSNTNDSITARQGEALARIDHYETLVGTIDPAAIAAAMSAALEHCREAKGHRAPAGPTGDTTAAFCNPMGREGAELPYTPYSREPTNGWADSTCTDLADNSGLCPACRIRERRWRTANGLKPRNYETDAA